VASGGQQLWEGGSEKRALVSESGGGLRRRRRQHVQWKMDSPIRRLKQAKAAEAEKRTDACLLVCSLGERTHCNVNRTNGRWARERERESGGRETHVQKKQCMHALRERERERESESERIVGRGQQLNQLLLLLRLPSFFPPPPPPHGRSSTT
jgi:hypothetical protein